MENKLIIGDNLLALQEMEGLSVDCIVTDPPYNTKSKTLSYSDAQTSEQWLDFMRLRLIECRRVLKKTGTLLIHIDERMHIELAVLLYQIFGKKNHIATLIWKKKNTSNQSRFVLTEHEYILAVAKDIKQARWNHIPQIEPKNKLEPYELSGNKALFPHSNQNYPIYFGADEQDRLQKFQTSQLVGIGPKQSYPLFFQDSKDKEGQKISLSPFPGATEINPLYQGSKGHWRCIPTTCQKLIDADMLVIQDGKVYLKQYAHFQFNKKTGVLEPYVRTVPLRSILQGADFPTNRTSHQEIKEIFGSSVFTYAKPLALVKNLLKIVSQEGDLILDIFAGSGTTGQAAYELKRQFLLIQTDQEEGDIPRLTQQRLDQMVGRDNYVVSSVKRAIAPVLSQMPEIMPEYKQGDTSKVAIGDKK